MTNRFLLFLAPLVLFALSAGVLAAPLSCMKLSAETGGWTPKITLTNECGERIDMQGAVLSFDANQSVGGSFWGSFSSLAYPQENTITQANVGSHINALLQFKFPQGNQWWKPNSKLNAGESITIQFSGHPNLVLSSLVFSAGGVVTPRKGQLTINLPNNPTQNPGLKVKVTLSNDNGFNKVLENLSFNQSLVVEGLPFGSYLVNVDDLEEGGEVYQASVSPNPVSINTSTGAVASVNFTKLVATGSINVSLNQSSPVVGITNVLVTAKDKTTNETLETKSLNFGGNVTFSNLVNGHLIEVSATSFEGKSHLYLPEYHPSQTISAVKNETVPLAISFNPVALETTTINLTISGLASGAQATLEFNDNKNNRYGETISNGSHSLQLPINRQYELSAPLVSHNDKTYKATLSSSSFVTASGQSLSITVDYQEVAHSTRFSPYVDVTLGTVTKWDSVTQSMQPIGLIEMVEAANLNSLHLAFITGRSGCTGTWAGYPVENRENGYAVPVFKELKARGVKLNIALGGLSGQYLAQVCDSEAALVSAYQEIIDAYQPDLLDFDVENSLQTDNVKLQRMMRAIKTIQANNHNIPISFTLPVLPDGLVSGVGLNVLVQAKNSGLSQYGVNIMAMDYGPYYSQKTMGEYAIDALISTFNQLKALYPNQSDAHLWSRLEVTPMIGLNDTVPQNFSLADVDTLKAFALDKGIGMLSIWSLTRDKSCNVTYASPVCSSQNPATGQPNQSEDYEFSLRFQQ